MSRELKDLLDLRRKLIILELGEQSGKVSRICREFEVPRSSYYRWEKAFQKDGEAGLIKKKPIPKHHPNQIPQETVEKVLYLRRKYHLGPQRIAWYLKRYHEIKISCSSVCRILRRNGMQRLPKKVGRRAVHTKRYAKKVPGHHIQIDVKFLTLKKQGKHRVRRYQYTAIDDATRIRALKIYDRHNQKSSIDFIDYVVEKFPFRINTVRTDRGHEWQAKFHWYVEDKGIRHVYIKPRTPQLNGKVKRSLRTDQDEFYQILNYTDDVDLGKKLAEWENFYNFGRPHGAHSGKTPYEALRNMLKS